MMFRSRFLLIFVLLAGLGGIHFLQIKAAAQDPWEQNSSPPTVGRPYKDGKAGDSKAHRSQKPENRITSLKGKPEKAYSAPNETSGPDEFGYTWDDGETFSWTPAITNTGITGDDESQGRSIGFLFPFYDQSWSQVYITTNGILIFGSTDDGCCGGFSFPSPGLPNNVVAPFSEDLLVGDTFNNGAIYTSNGGSFPNRFFVVEWRDVTLYGDDDLNNTYTFQAILHEDGDIVFRYQVMNGYLGFATSGIEDSLGLDGLEYPYQVSDGLAIRFIRPAPQPWVTISPYYQGTFVGAGDTISYTVDILNSGETGADVYDLSKTSMWTTTLYASDGVSPLVDTDFDSMIDTGNVPEGSSVTVVAKVEVPATATVGVRNVLTMTATSSLDPRKSKSAYLQAAVPAEFAQVMTDDADGVMKFYLAKPGSQTAKSVSPASYWDSDMTVAVDRMIYFAYVWNKSGDIEYTLLDDNANIITSTRKLTANGPGVRDYDPVVAMVNNGKIGVIWIRELFDNIMDKYNYNVWFAILDPTGEISFDPANMTNNTAWVDLDSAYPGFYQPVISNLSENRFILSWTREDLASGCGTDCYVDNIYYTVLDDSGGQVKPVTQLTADGPGLGAQHEDSNLTHLFGNRALLSWECEDTIIYWDICYVVLDMNGNLVKGITNATSNVIRFEDNVDAVQLFDGNILLTWHEWHGDVYKIGYGILDSAYKVISGPSVLENPAGLVGNIYPSVAVWGNKAVITWMEDGKHQHLYYALVDSSGNVVTQPIIFQRSQVSGNSIWTSVTGYGNTEILPFERLDKSIYLPMVLRGN